jgi:hypothetical protein
VVFVEKLAVLDKAVFLVKSQYAFTAGIVLKG